MKLTLPAVAVLVTVTTASTGFAAMIPQPIAILQGLDKVAARVSQIEAPVGKSVNFGTLSILVRDCETSPADEAPNNAAFIQIYETPHGEGSGSAKRLFSGWMFSSSPALSGLEHPVYDVTLLGCKAPIAPAPPPPPPPAPPNPGGKPQR
jgi:hypothetical protein